MEFDIRSIVRARAKKPPRIVIHGEGKIGKSTFGAQAPNPVFLPIEDGLDHIDAAMFPRPTRLEHVWSAFSALASGGHDYKTLVIDSLDWLEPLIWRAVCEANNWATIEEPGYGKGYVAVTEVWRNVAAWIESLRASGIATIMIAHSTLRKIDQPDSDPYDRWEPKIHQKAWAIIAEMADLVLFGYRPVSVAVSRDQKGRPQRKIARASVLGESMVRCRPSGVAVAGARWPMPERLPLHFPTVAAHIPYYAEQYQSAAQDVESAEGDLLLESEDE